MAVAIQVLSETGNTELIRQFQLLK